MRKLLYFLMFLLVAGSAAAFSTGIDGFRYTNYGGGLNPLSSNFFAGENWVTAHGAGRTFNHYSNPYYRTTRTSGPGYSFAAATRTQAHSSGAGLDYLYAAGKTRNGNYGFTNGCSYGRCSSYYTYGQTPRANLGRYQSVTRTNLGHRNLYNPYSSYRSSAYIMR